MTGTADAAAFAEVATARAPWMRRFAVALCSGDGHQAEDLTQEALVRLYAAWPIRDVGAVDAWLRRTLVRLWIDQTRRPFRVRERPVHAVPEVAAPEVEADDVAEWRRLLAGVPPRQRACLVLRFVEDLSVEQTAAVLGISTGAVKSNTARGLEAARSRYAQRVEGGSTTVVAPVVRNWTDGGGTA
jgi:RNA polymerase sigma-70 factor (sigma-E family)